MLSCEYTHQRIRHEFFLLTEVPDCECAMNRFEMNCSKISKKIKRGSSHKT